MTDVNVSAPSRTIVRQNNNTLVFSKGTGPALTELSSGLSKTEILTELQKQGIAITVPDDADLSVSFYNDSLYVIISKETNGIKILGLSLPIFLIVVAAIIVLVSLLLVFISSVASSDVKIAKDPVPKNVEST